MAGYNCGRIAADGIGTCYGQLSSSGSCEPCDSNLEANTGIQKTRGVPSRGSLVSLSKKYLDIETIYKNQLNDFKA